MLAQNSYIEKFKEAKLQAKMTQRSVYVCYVEVDRVYTTVSNDHIELLKAQLEAGHMRYNVTVYPDGTFERELSLVEL